jgi:hypothetical protein
MQRLHVIVLLAVILFLLLVIAQPVEFHLTNLTFVDDGFYYLGYARNIALGNGPTFDGLVETNGVQPAWALLLIGVTGVVSDGEGLMRASMLLAIVLVVISVLAMNDVLKQLFAPTLRVPVLLFYLAFIGGPQIVLSGMETPVNLALLTLALAAVLRVRSVMFKPTVFVGILVGLACLARVDTVIIVPAFALILLWRNDVLERRDRDTRGKALRSLFWFGVPVAVIFGGYLLFNVSVFGRALPVSGEIKSTLQGHIADAIGGRLSPAYLVETTRAALEQWGTIFNNYLTTELISFSPATLLARGVLALGVVILVIVFIHGRRTRRTIAPAGFHWPLALAVTAIFLFHTWMLFFQLGRNASVLNWYYVPEYIFITLTIGLLLANVERRINSQRFYSAVTIWLLVSMAASAAVFVRQFQQADGVTPLLTHYRVTQWANENLPHDEIIGSFNAGVIGYFSDARVINLDGLMNDEEILEVARGNSDLASYVQRHNIAWILDYAPANWSIESAADFQGIPTPLLLPIYSQPFDNYGFQPSVFYVFRVDYDSVITFSNN